MFVPRSSHHPVFDRKLPQIAFGVQYVHISFCGRGHRWEHFTVRCQAQVWLHHCTQISVCQGISDQLNKACNPKARDPKQACIIITYVKSNHVAIFTVHLVTRKYCHMYVFNYVIPVTCCTSLSTQWYSHTDNKIHWAPPKGRDRRVAVLSRKIAEKKDSRSEKF